GRRRQGMQAPVLYDEVERAGDAGDAARVERAFDDVRDKYGRTTYAQQAGLLAAKVLLDKGKPDQAKAALAWVAEHGKDDGYQAIARLRLAAVLADAKQYDEALKQLNAEVPKEYAPLAARRRGDIVQVH